MQLTVRQAAELLRVPEAMIRRGIVERSLPAVLFNEQYRLNRIDLIVWAQVQQISLPEAALARPVQDPVALHDALARGGIHRDVPGGERRAALRSALERVRLPAGVDRGLLAEMVLARDKQGAATMGRVAIPHARYPTIAPGAPAVLALCWLAQPVDFGAPDGQPISALFLIVTPTTRVHLALLARLAMALSSTLCDLVLQKAPDAAILAAARAADEAAAARAAGGRPR